MVCLQGSVNLISGYSVVTLKNGQTWSGNNNSSYYIQPWKVDLGQTTTATSPNATVIKKITLTK